MLLDLAAPQTPHDSTSLPHTDPPGTWAARLSLRYARRERRTVLVSRRHDGPLVVQKPLYPEGDGVCHSIIVHPPAGIVGGDSLTLSAQLDHDAHALLTTPGAGKWYRSAGHGAEQRIAFTVASGACLEWLPQETIVFDGAVANMDTSVHLAHEGRFIGWEILCLGRSGAGERFARGACRLHTRILHGDRLAWWERGVIAPSTRANVQQSPVGLHHHAVSATMIAAGATLDAETLNATRAVAPRAGVAAVTQLPGVWLARYLGDSSEAAREYFVALWHLVRPTLIGRDAATPRIWRT